MIGFSGGYDVTFLTHAVSPTWARTGDERGSRFLLVRTIELVEEDKEAHILGH